MIEIIPENVKGAFIYFHSAGQTSEELRPFLEIIRTGLPDTYIWAGDGFISDSPLMFQGANYGNSAKRYWFMFPMQDACTGESFRKNKEAMGASLLSAGAFANNMIDQIRKRFDLSGDSIILSGFQHGSSLALATAMMRTADPFKYAVLFEPFLLEAYYLDKEAVNRTTEILCVDNEHIRKRTYGWFGLNTDEKFGEMGMTVRSFTVRGGDDTLSPAMMESACRFIREN